MAAEVMPGWTHSFALLRELLEPAQRRRLLGLLALMWSVALFEAVSVTAVFPFVASLLDPEFVRQQPWLNGVRTQLGIESARAFTMTLAGVFGLLVVLSIVLRAVTQHAVLKFSADQNARWTGRLLAAYLAQPYVWYLDRHSADLGRVLLAQVQEVINTSLIPALQLVVQGTVAVAIVLVLIAMVPSSALVGTVVIAAVYTLVFRCLRRRLVQLGDQKIAADTLRYRLVGEAIGGLKEVKIHRLEAAYVSRLAQPLAEVGRIIALQSLLSQTPRHVLEAMGFAALAVVMIVLLAQGADQARAIPIMSLFGFAAYRLLPAIQNLYQGLVSLRFNVTALRRLVDDLRAAPSLSVAPSGTPLPLHHALSLDAVHFAYPNAGRAALDGLTLTIEAGQTVAIVGSSGAGKTTLADVLLGLLNPQSGTISVDGVALAGARWADWQASLGYVPQQIFLTDDSIAANVAFGVPADQRDHARVVEACRAAALQEFVTEQLVHGYDTPIGERGVRLSGGQRQRIGIARALYRQPSVLIFDEATSALDNLTEGEVMAAVDALRGDKTVIIIAHRLSTVRHCDQIFVLEHGRLLAQGRYDALIEHCPTFAQMARSKTMQSQPKELSE